MVDTIIGNCTITIPMKRDLHGKDAGHTWVVARTRSMFALLDALQREQVKADGANGLVVPAKRCSPRS